MARLRYNGLATTLGGSGLAPADTAVTFSGALTHSGGIAVPTISGGDYIPLTLLDSSGNVAEIVNLTAYTSGTLSGTIARAQESTTAKSHAAGVAAVHAPTVSDVQAGVLAYNSYNPATLATFSTSGTTATDADPVNMAVTFKAPISGAVVVTLSAAFAATNVGTFPNWILREGATQVALRYLMKTPVANGEFPGYVDLTVTGLTPGSSHTYKWAHSVDIGTAKIYAGGAAGPAVMKVIALP